MTGGVSLPALSWTDWLSLTTLSVALVALALWIADRFWALWRLRRRPLVASRTPQRVKVRLGEAVVFLVKIENRSPRVLQVRLGALIQPISTLEGGSARRSSDGRAFQPVDYIEIQGFDLQYFFYGLAAIRPGRGSIRPNIEITGVSAKSSRMWLQPFEFEVASMNVNPVSFGPAGLD